MDSPDGGQCLDMHEDAGLDALRQQMADLAERLATVAENIAATVEHAAARGDAERRLAFAQSEREEAARLKLKATDLRNRGGAAPAASAVRQPER